MNEPQIVITQFKAVGRSPNGNRQYYEGEAEYADGITRKVYSVAVFRAERRGVMTSLMSEWSTTPPPGWDTMIRY